MAEFRGWFEAGFLIRGGIINDLKGSAWKLGLEFDHERAGSVVRFKVSGSPDAVLRFREAFSRWGREMMADSDEHEKGAAGDRGTSCRAIV